MAAVATGKSWRDFFEKNVLVPIAFDRESAAQDISTPICIGLTSVEGINPKVCRLKIINIFISCPCLLSFQYVSRFKCFHFCNEWFKYHNFSNTVSSMCIQNLIMEIRFKILSQHELAKDTSANRFYGITGPVSWSQPHIESQPGM